MESQEMLLAIKEAVLAGDTRSVVEIVTKTPFVAQMPLDTDGTTVLHLAANSDNPSIPRTLIDSGADIDAQNHDGLTPLHVAAINGCLEALKVLLEGGADVSLLDNDGMSPIDHAEEEHQWRCFEVLKQHMMDNEEEEETNEEVEISMCEAYVEMVLEEDQTELQALEEEQSDEEDTIVAYNNSDLINLPSYSDHKGSKELVSQGEVADQLNHLSIASTDVSSIPEDYVTASEGSPEKSKAIQKHSLDQQGEDKKRTSLITSNENLSEASIAHTTSPKQKPSTLDCVEIKPFKTTPLLKLTNPQLRDKLIELGEEPGPINEHTRGAYLKYLEKILQGVQPAGNKGYKGFKYELALCLNGTAEIPDLHREENTVFVEFRSKGQAKTFFNYLLIDPTVIKSLDSTLLNHDGSEHDMFQSFVEAIFYVGKGKCLRSFQHLKDAKRGVSGKKKPIQSEKVKRILNIWKSGHGVLSLHVFNNIAAGEAYCREAAIIESIGIENLTNVVKGHYHGTMSRWSPAQRRRFGVYLLHKVYRTFAIDTPQQIFPEDI